MNKNLKLNTINSTKKKSRFEKNIPSTWSIKKFGEICKIQGGYAFKSSDYKKQGVPLIRISNLVNGEVQLDSNTVFLSEDEIYKHQDLLLKTGDVLVALSGATTGKMAAFNQDITALLNQRVGRFKILSNEITNDKYIKWLVTYLRPIVLEYAYGAAQPNISPSQIEDIEVPFPPIHEQLRIVAEIEKQFTRLDAGVAALKRLQKNLKRYRASVLKAACEGKLVPTEAELARQEGREYEHASVLLERILKERREKWMQQHPGKKYVEPKGPDTSNLPELPEGWVYSMLAPLLSLDREGIKTGPFGSLLKKHEHKTSGIPVLGIENIMPMRYIPGNRIFITHFKAKELSSYNIIADDILISRSGTVGEVCVVPQSIGDSRFSTNIIRVVLNKSIVLPSFFSLLFNGSPFILKQISNLCSGSTRDFLNQKILNSLCFPFPPIEEQRRIIDKIEIIFSSTDRIESTFNVNIIRSDRLRQAVLQRAFEVELV